ncbi:MAG: chemotaxis protein CheW [Actinomycetota bacterium]|nr:chemotaxis protein CheW [Actinomycetota bacterium]
MEKFIIFRLSDELFGVGIGRVVEILNLPQANHLPETPEYIVGVINVRGELVPLVDLRKRFGLGSMPKKERVVIVRCPEKTGLVVDEVMEIKGFVPGDLSSPPEIFRGIRTEYLKGLAKLDQDRIAILLNMERVISSEEQINLSALRK